MPESSIRRQLPTGTDVASQPAPKGGEGVAEQWDGRSRLVCSVQSSAGRPKLFGGYKIGHADSIWWPWRSWIFVSRPGKAGMVTIVYIYIYKLNRDDGTGIDVEHRVC